MLVKIFIWVVFSLLSRVQRYVRKLNIKTPQVKVGFNCGKIKTCLQPYVVGNQNN